VIDIIEKERSIGKHFWFALVSTLVIGVLFLCDWISISFLGFEGGFSPYELYLNLDTMSELFNTDGISRFLQVFLILAVISYVFAVLSLIMYTNKIGRLFAYIGFGISSAVHLGFIALVIYTNAFIMQAWIINYAPVPFMPVPLISTLISLVVIIFFFAHDVKPQSCPKCRSLDSYSDGVNWVCNACKHFFYRPTPRTETQIDDYTRITRKREHRQEIVKRSLAIAAVAIIIFGIAFFVISTVMNVNTSQDTAEDAVEDTIDAIMQFSYDNGIYEGEASNGKPNGTGSIIWADGRWYNGEWENGRRTGFGMEVVPNSWTYVGEFLDGKFHGWGKMTMEDGRWYDGEWDAGWQKGLGEVRDEAGNTYTAIFDNGRIVQYLP
jgi:hypothetical protein